MGPRYLLDTNICIYLMKHQPPQVVERFGRCRVGEVGVSAITAAELAFGVAASGSDQQHNRDALDKLIAAHALAPGAILITNNPRDFQSYPGLVIENWSE
jgi:tRNA(fMet)-specific endonuclease VapC